MNLKQPSSVGTRLVALGDHLPNLGLLLLGELRTPAANSTLFTCGIQPGFGPFF
jgi:hypothetical protein